MPVDAVNLSVWLNLGSAVEPDEINGMAHFLEHMIFKGTPSIQSGEFERAIEQRGAVTNAATSQDYTNYYITTAPKDFAELAPLQVDVLLNASIPDDAFDRERLVVLEEIRRSEDNPRRRTYQRSMELAFEVLPYKRPVLPDCRNRTAYRATNAGFPQQQISPRIHDSRSCRQFASRSTNRNCRRQFCSKKPITKQQNKFACCRKL